MPIIGCITVNTEFQGNKMSTNALVSKGGDNFLLGMPGAEKHGLIIDCRNKSIKFLNGIQTSYRLVSKRCQCQTKSEPENFEVRPISPIPLKSPKHLTVLLPGERLTLQAEPGQVLGKHVAIVPHENCKPITDATSWLTPSVSKVDNRTVVVKNSSRNFQKVASKDLVAHVLPLVEANQVLMCSEEEFRPRPPAESSWKDITLDPDNILTSQVKEKFNDINRNFSQVFQSDLPRYNGCFGRVEAVINVPTNIPNAARLKQVPWYPKSRLIELQNIIDELEEKGALARPQDIGVDVQVVSPSFLVAKKPASKGFRMVTAFGQLASLVKVPPTPITSVDQVLRWRMEVDHGNT